MIWINKSPWRKPGPIVYIGLLNALSFARLGVETELFVAAGEASDTETDLVEFYGLTPCERLSIHRVPHTGGADGRGPGRLSGWFAGAERGVYRAALAEVARACEAGARVLVLTRELGCLPALFRLRRRFPQLRVMHEAHDFLMARGHRGRWRWSDLRRLAAERLLLPRLDALVTLTEYQRALYAQHLPGLPVQALPLGTLIAEDGLADGLFGRAGGPATVETEADSQENAEPPQVFLLPRGAEPALAISRGHLEDDAEARRSLRTVAYVGHLHAGKGLERLLELAVLLAPEGVRFVCLGGHPHQTGALTDRARTLGLAHAIEFMPFVAPRVMHRWLAERVSVALVPLADTYYNRYLTCPVKALDALSQGLPVVASDLPGVRAVLGEAALYGDVVVEQAAAIRSLLDDARCYARARAASRERARALSWTRRARAILQLAETLA